MSVSIPVGDNGGNAPRQLLDVFGGLARATVARNVGNLTRENQQIERAILDHVETFEGDVPYTESRREADEGRDRVGEIDVVLVSVPAGGPASTGLQVEREIPSACGGNQRPLSG